MKTQLIFAASVAASMLMSGTGDVFASEPPHYGPGCPTPGTRSPSSNAPTQMHFANSAGTTLQIYWIDFNGNWNFYQQLYNGQDYVQPTYVGHLWVGLDPNGRCVDGVFEARPGNSIAEFFGD